MSLHKQFAFWAILVIAAFASAAAQAGRVGDTQDRWNARQEKLAIEHSLWQDAGNRLFAALPANLQSASGSKLRSEPVAYWGWYGPAYRYGYWGPGPYRYYRYYGVPYNAYYGGYPGYYPDYYGPRVYGPRVGVRVYPYGRVWGGYWY